MVKDGYFTEALGYHCVDAGFVPGYIHDVDLALLLEVRKIDLWPIQLFSRSYSEDYFFDVIEFLCQHVSKPTKGIRHDYGDCGMHWEIFNGYHGREHFRMKVNAVLSHYERKFELAKTGEILHKPEAGFEKLMEAEIPAKFQRD